MPLLWDGAQRAPVGLHEAQYFVAPGWCGTPAAGQQLVVASWVVQGSLPAGPVHLFCGMPQGAEMVGAGLSEGACQLFQLLEGGMFPTTVSAEAAGAAHKPGHHMVTPAKRAREDCEVVPLPWTVEGGSMQALYDSLGLDSGAVQCLHAMSEGVSSALAPGVALAPSAWRLQMPSRPTPAAAATAAEGETPSSAGLTARLSVPSDGADAPAAPPLRLTVLLQCPLLRWCPESSPGSASTAQAAAESGLFVPSAPFPSPETLGSDTLVWKASVYSVGTVRCAGWPGGGKAPSDALQEMRRRFASGSMRRIVQPYLQWDAEGRCAVARALEALVAGLAGGGEGGVAQVPRLEATGEGASGSMATSGTVYMAEEGDVRHKRVALGPCHNLVLQLEGGGEDPFTPPSHPSA